jgi:hypothetical protein
MFLHKEANPTWVADVQDRRPLGEDDEVTRDKVTASSGRAAARLRKVTLHMRVVTFRCIRTRMTASSLVLRRKIEVWLRPPDLSDS